MRLNRGTVIFFLLLIVVIAVAYVLMNNDVMIGSQEATATPLIKQALFPNVDSGDVSAITISQNVPVEDTRPTPLPGEDPLPTLTPVPEGETAPTQTEILSVVKDDGGNWVAADDSTVNSSSPVDVSKIESTLTTLINAQAESFVPEDGDYTQYGLDNPEYEITFVVKASSTDATPSADDEPVTRKLRVGERSFDNLGFYAFLDDDSKTVYVISSASSFKSNVLDKVTTPPFAPTPTPIPPITVDVPGPIFSSFDATTASRFSMSDTTTGDSLVLAKLDDGVNWTIENGDPSRTVSQPQVTAAFQDIVSVQSVSKASIEDLSTVGLDKPSYTIKAEFADGRTIDVSLGNEDPTGTLYYAHINDVPDVILINASEIDNLLSLIANPPYAVEVTPEATVEATEAMVEATDEPMVEMTAEATDEAMVEATQEMTAEATDEAMIEATAEMTAEATQASD